MDEIVVFAATHIGLEKNKNEDSVMIGSFISQAPWSGVLQATFDRSSSLVLAVADGVGGQPHGDRASREACTVINDLTRARSNDQEIDRALRQADAKLRAISVDAPEHNGMATTICGLLIDNETVHMFNVGDTECHLWQGEYFTRVSTNDSGSVSSPLERTNIVTQVIGGVSDRAAKPLTPHIRKIELRHKYPILICSDGLTDYVPMAAIERTLSNMTGGRGAVESLVKQALDGGGGDNVSVMLVGASGHSQNYPKAATTESAIDQADRSESTGDERRLLRRLGRSRD